MSLCYREQRQLRDIEAGLLRSDSHLAGMLETFGRLYRGQDMPASERVGITINLVIRGTPAGFADAR